MILRALARWPIRRQILTLAALPILAVCALAVAFYKWEPEDTQLSQAELAAAQIALVADQIATAASPADVATVLDATRAAGLPVAWIAPGAARDAPGTLFEERIVYALSNIYGRAAREIAGEGGGILVAIALPDGLLAFDPEAVPVPNTLNDFILMQAVLIVLLLILLSAYATRLVTAPLVRLASAAQAPAEADPAEGAFPEAGPREIRLLGRRLNEMRGEIRAMLDQRTGMLRAVSHDLRTPLTRLRLRVERAVPGAAGALLLRDIAQIDDMIDETLEYLRAEGETEAPRAVDLPSLLRTIASDFADVGFPVTYSGPNRLAFVCRPRALSRAVSNLVDNGTKFGVNVEVSLAALPEGAVRIVVSDDGDGLPETLHAQMLEPFAKGDPSRAAASRGGFGLGLAIAHEVARRDGGTLSLASRDPTGLEATIRLPDPGQP